MKKKKNRKQNSSTPRARDCLYGEHISEEGRNMADREHGQHQVD